MANFDVKTAYRELYAPKTTPGFVDVPEILFLMVDGKGDPNTVAAYQNAVEALYGLSYGIKMSKMGGAQLEGYYEYIVPPLEGLWWTAEGGFDASKPGEKDKLLWTAMIRQPEFVTAAALDRAKLALEKKKPNVDASGVRLELYREGLCVQVMHRGPYDTEPATVAEMDAFAKAQGYCIDFSDTRKHHEIYLNDPRKTEPEKIKTVLRHPISLLTGL